MAMARRWTPQRFVTLRRIRVIACIAATSIALAGSFAFTARKSVALNINGQTTQVTTYAMTATRLLEEQGVDIKTHDIVTTSSGDQLANHAVVTVQSAYQTTINIDGTSVPFWTVATSADQLLGFFEENQNNATKITVDIDNVYNQLTGGLVINQDGPVTVIADGKTSVAPNGKLPAASILDSKGIVLNKEDRVSVEKDGDTTILRVRRVTHGEETRTAVVPYSTQTIIDSNLPEGQSEIRQQGVNGEKTQVYNVTYVDGVAESETLKSETVTTMAIDQIIAVGAAKSDTDKGSDKGSGNDSADNGKADSGSNNQHESSGNNANNTGDKNNSSSGNNTNTDTNNNAGNTGGNNRQHRQHRQHRRRYDRQLRQHRQHRRRYEQQFRLFRLRFRNNHHALRPTLARHRSPGSGLCRRCRRAARVDRQRLGLSGQTMDPRVQLAVVCRKRELRCLRHSSVATSRQNGCVRCQLP